MRDDSRATLAPLGFELRVSETGAAGLLAAGAEACGLVLLDLAITDMPGWDALAALKAKLPATPLITASPSSEDRARAVELGACEHLTSPLERDMLATAAVRFGVAATAKTDDARTALMRA